MFPLFKEFNIKTKAQKKIALLSILLFFMLQSNFIAGQTGSALHFDGVNDKLSAPANSLLEFTDGTVEMWIKPEVSSGGANFKPLIGLRSGGTTRWSYSIHNNINVLAVWNGNGSKVWNYTFTAGQWYHLAFVEEGTTISAYVDNVLISTQSYGGSSGTTGLPLNIANQGDANHYKGAIDEVRIWNIPRSASDLQATMDSQLCGNEPGLVAYYQLNEGVANGSNAGVTNAPDLSSTGNDATLTDFTLSGGTSNWIDPSPVSLSPPYLFDVTSTGSLCVGGVGIGLSGSLTGWNYQLQNSGSNGQILAGTGSALSFSGSYNSGTFTVEATRTSDNFVKVMNGSIVVSSSSQTLYVDEMAVGSNDGSSWTDAYTDLQSALTSSCPGITRIQVAAGTYKPTSGTDRTISFVMKEGVEILGGYPTGGGTRDWATNLSILSGDIGVLGSGDNSYHVINNSGLNNTAILDGFTISDGNANGSSTNSQGGGMYNSSASPTIRNCTFSYNQASTGGGMYNLGSAPVITNCRFNFNTSTSNSGGIHNQSSSSPAITNCLFYSNSGASGGGIGCFAGSSPNIINCTFSDNMVTGNGGAIFTNNASVPVITNSILWDNGGAAEIAGSATVTYSIIDGGTAGTGNLDADPLFVNASGPSPDYSLNDCSPALDAGDGIAGSSVNTNNTDLAGNSRFFNSVIDMGAYEVQGSSSCCPADGILYVDDSATGNNDGSSWTDAYTDLQSALTSSCPGITRIQVAAGTYKPTSSTDRTIAFVMKNDIEILGGYPDGGGTRDWSLYPTVLNGEIGASGSSDNSYHLINNTGLNNTAILDGFIISDGNADGSGTNGQGGGMYNNSASPTILNCTFFSNKASFGGGIYNLGSAPVITNCMFNFNTSTSNSGGIHNQSSSSPTITNCLFLNNSAANGGAMGCFASSSPAVVNCTFTGNMATGNGGAVFTNNASVPVITNSILWDNTGGAEITGSATVNYSIVKGGRIGIENLDTDPLFVSVFMGDYSLSDCSPAIDAGDSNAGSSVNTTTTDLSGNLRFFNSLIDRGAYERQQVNSPACCLAYHITLSTQTEVDNFVNCTEIASLTIKDNNDGVDNITNLSGLSGLTSVTDDVIIESNPALMNLDGLSALTSIGGDLKIWTNTSLTDIDGLYALTSIGGGLWFIGNNSLTDIDGLSALTNIGGYLEIFACNALTNLDGLSALTSIGEWLLIQDNDVLTNLDGLSVLTSIGTHLEIVNNGSLTHIDGLSSLISIGTYLTAINNDALTNLDGLSALTSIGGKLEIDNNDALVNLNGLSALTNIDGNLLILNNDQLTSVGGLSSLTNIGLGLVIFNNDTLIDLNGLSALTGAITFLFIDNNDVLINIDGLSNLTGFGGVEIKNNNALTNIDGLSGLTNITDGESGLRIESNNSLTNLDGLSALTNITGSLVIEENASLTDLNGLSALTNITSGLFITDNNSLYKCCALDALLDASGVIGSITMTGNETCGCNNNGANVEACDYCNASSVLPTAAGFYTGDYGHTDVNGWTHYCSCAGELLLSLEEGGTGIKVSPTGVTVEISTPTVEYHASGTGFITNPYGAIVFNRSWDVVPTTSPTSAVPVRSYFTAAEYAAINAELVNQSQTPLTAPSEMWFYKATSGTAHDAIANIPTAIVLSNGTASTSEWALGTQGSDYYSEYHVTSFSGGGGGGADAGSTALLPVEMLYFSCSEAGKNVQLNWATALEENNQGFEVERSTDAQNFTNIGWVAGQGTTASRQNYAFLDHEVQTNTQYYYRLKQLDFDGRFEYSDLRSIILESGATNPILIYPNPVKGDVLSIQLENNIESDIQVALFDLTGRMLLNQDYFGTRAEVKVAQFPMGIYLVTIHANGQTSRGKIVVE